MKKIISLMLIMCVLLGLTSYTGYANTYEKGDGTKDNPYVITNETEFNAIRNNPSAHYLLNSDITLSENYIPFEFSGSLLGANEEVPYSITVNIDSYSSYTNPIGLFTILRNATLKNLKLKGRVSGYSYVGGFFGRTVEVASSLVLENLINEATVIGKGSYVGGIGASVAPGVKASNLINSGAIYAKGYVGGIFAIAFDATKLGNSGHIQADGDYAGGIVGELKGTLSKCYNSGNVSAVSFSGGIAGSVNGEELVISESFNVGDVNASNSNKLNIGGGIVGGIKTLKNNNLTIKESYNASKVVNNNYIYPSYLPYDETNFIALEDVYYVSEADGKIRDAHWVMNSQDLSSNLGEAFIEKEEVSFPVLCDVEYKSYVAPTEEVIIPNDEEKPLDLSFNKTKEYILLNALGIIENYNDPSRLLNRGEFADLVSKAFLYNLSYAKKDSYVFYDVDSSYAYYDAIKAVTDLKIMTSDSFNRFYPERSITVNEAVTAIIRAVGYEIYAINNGGYPTGYTIYANRLGLLKNVKTSGDTPITIEDAINLIYNSLMVDVISSSGVSNGNVNIEVTSGVKYLNTVHNVYLYDAILTDNRYTNDDSLDVKSAKIIVTEFGTGKKMLLSAADAILSKLGQRLDLFVRENESKSTVIGYFESEKETLIKIKGDNLLNLTSTELVYFDEATDKNEILKFNTSFLPDVYINGSYTTSYYLSDLNKGNVTINAIDNDSDKYIDFLNIYKYDYDVVVGNIIENSRIMAYSGSSYDLVIDKEKSNLVFTQGSTVDEISLVTDKDVISVAKANFLKDGNPVYYLTVTRNSVSGEYTSFGGDYITVSGKDYDISYAMSVSYPNLISKIQFGSDITLFLNQYGEISYIYDGIATSDNFAFVLTAKLSSDYEPEGFVKLLTGNGEVNTYKVSEKVKSDDVKVTDLSSFITKLNNTNNDLIKYEINSDNELSKVYFQKPATADENYNQSIFSLDYEITANSRFDEYVLDGIGMMGTIVFSVPKNYETDGSDSRVGDVFVRSEYYSGIKCYDIGLDGICTVALYRPEGNSTSFLENPNKGYLFEKFTTGYDEDYGQINKMYYYDAGVLKSVLVSPDVTIVPNASIHRNANLLTEININDISEIKAGDYLCFLQDSNGLVSVISVIYQASKHGNYASGIVHLGGEGTGYSYELSIYEGILQYKSASLLTLRLDPSKYQFEVVNCTGQEPIYKVNRLKGTITPASDTELNVTNFAAGTTGDRIVVIAHRNSAREVIIYE